MKPAPIPVDLSWAEVRYAATIGVERHVYALEHGMQRSYGGQRDMPWWEWDVMGALGEFALAKWLNRWWDPAIGEIAQRDVAGFEVRTTSWAGGCLTVHPKDTGRYVLVTGDAPRFVLHGWIRAEDAKQERFWTDKSGTGRYAYFVPQGELADMQELRA